ncbi:MAG: L-threonylcarbamoyladenylate synthase [Planctomycetota bacterium]|jgi:protein-tyrosine phosphatase
MKTEILQIDSESPEPALIQKAASVIESGGLVVFPTETVYGIACLVRKDCLEKLNRVKSREPDKYYTLHIGERGDVYKYVPFMEQRAEKLVLKAWPGPLTIVFELDDATLEAQRKRFDAEVFANLYHDNSIGIRCPDNNIALSLLKTVRYPVVAPSANLADRPAAVNAGEALAQLEGQVDLVLDGGPCKYSRNSTIVKIGAQGIGILRHGAYSRDRLHCESTVNFLFVCTGNTCRSPMAEGIFKSNLAEKLGCKVDHLEEMGYKVLSAGTLSIAGLPASPEAVTACEAKGIDINAHSSRALTGQLIEESDYIFAMSNSHIGKIKGLKPEAVEKSRLLIENGIVPDPIGQSQQFYNDCSDMIEEAVKTIISELNV